MEPTPTTAEIKNVENPTATTTPTGPCSAPSDAERKRRAGLAHQDAMGLANLQAERYVRIVPLMERLRGVRATKSVALTEAQHHLERYRHLMRIAASEHDVELPLLERFKDALDELEDIEGAIEGEVKNSEFNLLLWPLSAMGFASEGLNNEIVRLCERGRLPFSLEELRAEAEQPIEQLDRSAA